MLLTEFDENKVAILNPSNITNKIEGMPKTCVSFFEYKLFEMFLDKFKPEIITSIGCAVREHPIYKVNFGGKDIAVMQAGIGEPYCVSNFEEVIELGVENILLFGSCGSLIPLNACSIIVPYAALRDEGTSYHYAPPSDEIELDKKLVKNLCDFFDSKNIKYQLERPGQQTRFTEKQNKKLKNAKMQELFALKWNVPVWLLWQNLEMLILWLFSILVTTCLLMYGTLVVFHA